MPCSAATAKHLCRSWPRKPRRTASKLPSRRCGSPSSTARRSILLSDGYLANGSEPWRLPDVDISARYLGRVRHSAECHGLRWRAGVLAVRSRPGDACAARGRYQGRRVLSTASADSKRTTEPATVSYDPITTRRWCASGPQRSPASPATSRRSSVDDPVGERKGPDARLGLYLRSRSRRRCRRVRSAGQSVAQLHLVHLNPFPPNLGEVLRAYDRVLVPERTSDSSARLVRAEFLVDAQARVQGAGRAVPGRRDRAGDLRRMLGVATRPRSRLTANAEGSNGTAATAKEA